MKFSFKKPKLHKTREGKIGLTLAAHKIDTVIDIGANIGQTRDNLRNAGFEGDIISVEPLPILQDSLQAKAKKDKKWRVLPPLAIGDHNGTCDINISEASDMSSILTSSKELMTALPRTRVMETASVPMKTLDSLYDELELEGKRVFVKMDTQGYEMKILKHASKTLNSILGLQVELSLFQLYEGEILFDEIIAFLKQKGFSPHMMIETNFSRKLNRQLQIDAVLFKD